MAKSYKDIQKEVFSEEFKKFCRKNIVKDLSKLEKRRKYYLWGIALVYFLGIVSLLFISYFTIINKETFDLRVISLTIFFATTVHCFITKCYKRQAKKIFLPKLISYIGNLEVIDEDNPLRCELENYVQGLKIIPHFNRFYCDDYFEGNYNDVKFSVSELKLEYESGSGKRRRVKIIFQGLLIFFKSFKKFRNDVIINRDSMVKLPASSRVTLEDPEFEKMFNVYGADQIEARYLITPAFMNRMVQLSKKPFANGVYASFENGMVNIFVPSKRDLFEMPITKPATDIVSYRAIVLELLSLFSIADTLKIDRNIGM